MNGRVPIVLLIEHDPIQRGTLARILKTAGYCVIPVGRAHEALETFAMHHVDIALVVANTQTTTAGGPPLLDTLFTFDPHVPVIVLSGGVAIERPAYEYPNVAATLMRPFEPADVLAAAEHVLVSDSAAFNWPPTEADLADIQVVDTATWESPFAPRAQALVKRAAEPAPIVAIVKPPDTPAPAIAAATPIAIALRTPAPIAPPAPITPVALVTQPAPATDIVRVEPAPGRLVIRGWSRRDLMPSIRISPRTRRSMAVAATAVCGLALTTLLELRGVPSQPQQAELTDETPAPELVSAPLLSSSDHRIDAMTLVSAWRARPRATADATSGAPAPVTPGAPAPVTPVAMNARATNAGTTPRTTTPRTATSKTTDTARQREAEPVRNATRLDGQRLDGARPDVARRTVPRIETGPATARAVPPTADTPLATARQLPPTPPGPSSSLVPSPRSGASAPVTPAPAMPSPAHAVATSMGAGAAPADAGVAHAARDAETAANVPAPAAAPPVASALKPATPSLTASVSRSADDERGIYQVLQRYERAYEHLDVNAARAVWPSLNARALARAFDGLKAQALEFSHCRVAMELAEATAICGGHASYVPRVGRQAARTESREWTFRLRKVDHDWLIAKAEVR